MINTIYIPDQTVGMIKIRNAVIYDFDYSVNASKFPMKTNTEQMLYDLGATQVKLAQSPMGEGHDNWLQGVLVAFDMDISAKALVEMERYHFINIVSSTSTMHRITKFDLDKSYNEYVDPRMIDIMKELVEKYNNDPTEENYLKILYSNPSGFTYTIRFTTNYRQLKTLYNQRRNHRLPEWKEFCAWIEKLLHSELITKFWSRSEQPS